MQRGDGAYQDLSDCVHGYLRTSDGTSWTTVQEVPQAAGPSGAATLTA
ncbi:hypothetical protein GCM10010347_23870 [Streptomyces cirratus]|uniref:Uncharacterized protein n=1 Tax=Streptomyces cirratus TaxID=68187 RepID=A0ABQ3ESX2_9ACTN|nr:hypothetical protein GCM10010347_23870 [Streptomyces cirratus]